MQTIRIGERLIGDNQPPFVIAEMSGNHNQSLERALELVHAAKRSGADALKLQTYTADTLTIKSENRDFFVSDENSRWRGSYLYDLYESAYTPWEWHKTIFDEARSKLPSTGKPPVAGLAKILPVSSVVMFVAPEPTL